MDSENIHTKIISISASDVPDTSPEDYNRFTVTLGNGPDTRECVKMSVLNVALLHEFYNVGLFGDDNKLRITVGVTNHDIVVPAGWYNVVNIASTLTTLINAAITPQTVTIVQNPTTYKFTFTFSTTVTISYDNSTLRQQIGLYDNMTGSTLTMARIPNLAGIQRIFINSRKIASNNLIKTTGEQISTLLVVPVTSPFGSMINYEVKDLNASSITHMYNPKNVSVIDFTITDDNGRALPMSFPLLMTIRCYHSVG